MLLATWLLSVWLLSMLLLFMRLLAGLLLGVTGLLSKSPGGQWLQEYVRQPAVTSVWTAAAAGSGGGLLCAEVTRPGHCVELWEPG
jgi:hypothetical protein